MTQPSQRGRLDDTATTIGILIGLMVGAIYAILRIKNRGVTTRKNLTEFGAGSLEMDIDSSLNDAKHQAHQRLNESDST
jgi:hypothetical protein